MKKYLYIIVALFCTLSACTDGKEIDINYSSGLTLNVSTQSVYDNFELTESLKNGLLGGKGYSIGIYSFIYNDKGLLVASDSTYVETFQRVNQNFKSMRDGNYTLVTLEMIVENEDDYSSPNWVILDKDNLETIKLVNKNYVSYWYSAVGLYTGPISINHKDGQEIRIDPKGIGVVINNYCMYFDSSNYVYVGFFTKDQPKGRLLSPSYTGADRFVHDSYNESDVWTSRGYIYNGGSPLEDYDGFDIYLLEEGLIRYCYGAHKLKSDGSIDWGFYPCPSANSTFTVKDGMTYFGGYLYKGGQAGQDCVANLFDTYNDFYKWYNENKVDKNSYVLPYLEWGSSFNSVKSYMTNAGLEFVKSDVNEATEIFWSIFRNSASTILYQYQFDKNQNNLKAVYTSFDTDYFNMSSIKSDLTKIYGEGDYNETLDGYIFSSYQTVLLLSNNVSDGYIDVLYIPNTATRGVEFQLIKRFG